MSILWLIVSLPGCLGFWDENKWWEDTQCVVLNGTSIWETLGNGKYVVLEIYS
jgi:hypothetical protein